MTIVGNSVDIEMQEQDVVDFLHKNLQFFSKYPDLLAAMQLSGDDVTPFHERQLAVLRQREHTLQDKLNFLMESIKTNQRLEEDLQNFARALLTGTKLLTLEERVAYVSELVKTHFHVDFAPIYMLQQSHEYSQKEQTQEALFERIAHKGSVCDDRLPSAIVNFLFPDNSEKIGSCALIPLVSDNALKSVLALGVSDRTRFVPSMGVLYLDRIGALASAYIFA